MVRSYKIAVVGDGAVGKSCLTIQLTQHQFVEEYDPTIEDAYRLQMAVDGITCVMDILDTAGQEEFASMRDQYFSLGDGFVIVYSVTERRSFENVAVFRTSILRAKDKEGFPIVVAGNKADLVDEREVPQSEGEELCRSFHCGFFETSAKTRLNVDECFSDCVRSIRTFLGEVSGKKKGGGGGCLLL